MLALEIAPCPALLREPARKLPGRQPGKAGAHDQRGIASQGHRFESSTRCGGKRVGVVRSVDRERLP